MEPRNVIYFGDGHPIGSSLMAAKTLFENAITLLEEVGVSVEEKDKLISLMNTVIHKADRRGLQEMSRTNIKGEILHPLADEIKMPIKNEESES